MNEDNELNLYNVVKYFIENSGMLFFYTKDDVRIAFNRINTIINIEKKYYNAEIDDKLNELKSYYDFFIKNFDQYSQIEENKTLFIDIMKYDSSIMFCGSTNSLKKYIEMIQKRLNDTNKHLPFFQRKKAVKDGMKQLNTLIRKIDDYRIFYELDVSTNKIDDALKFLKLESFAHKDEIVESYNRMFNEEYNNLMNSTPNIQTLVSKNKQFIYIKDVILGAYANTNLEMDSLLDKYSMSDDAISRAYDYFGLDSTCSKDEMINTVLSVIDDIKTIGIYKLANNVMVANRPIYVSGNVASLNGKGNNFVDTDSLLEIANFYKNVLYKKFGVKEKIVVKPVEKKHKASTDNNEDAYTMSFSTLFDGLSYEEAVNLYYSLMNRLLDLGNEKGKAEARNLEIYWNSIKDGLYNEKNVFSNNGPKR